MLTTAAAAAGAPLTGFASGFAGRLITTGSVQGACETGLSEGYQRAARVSGAPA